MILFRMNKPVIITTQILFTIISVLAILSVILGYVPLFWLLISYIVYFMMGCLGIVVTFHRFLSHRSFGMSKWMEYLFSIFGILGNTGSSISWVAVHRTHHKFSDKDNDPHPPHNGFWKNFVYASSMGEISKWTVRDLVTDKFHLYLHNYYNLIHIVTFVVLTLIDPLLTIFLYIVPSAMVVWGSMISNYVNHCRNVGYQSYNTDDDSINTPLLLPVNFGDCWHNNHHRFPWRHKFQIKKWEIDIAGWIIDLIKDKNYKVKDFDTGKPI